MSKNLLNRLSTKNQPFIHCIKMVSFEMARYLLLESKLPKNYALMTALYIWNWYFDKCIDKTEYLMFLGLKPNFSKMYISGTICYAYEQKTKLDAQSEQGIFVGSPAYLIYLLKNSITKKIFCVKSLDTLKNNKYKINNCC